MSTWELIEQALHERTIPVRLGRREAYIVREAHAALLKRSLDEGVSAWSVLGRLVEAPMQTAVKGLTPQEVQLIKGNKVAASARVKTGNTGEVVMLDPKSWLKIKQEMEANPEYYDMLGGGVADAQKVAQKIGDALQLVMGKGPASSQATPVEPPHGLAGGHASEMTPAVHGSEQFRMDEPKSSAKSSRAARVAAQDMAMMGAKSSKELGRMSQAGKMKVQDAYDRMEEDLTAEGIGKWARSAMAAGALGLAGGAMGADQPTHQPVPQQGHEIGVRPSGVSKPSKLSRAIDYKQGFRPEYGDYDTSDPMGGLTPEKKPMSNENAECPEEMQEAEGAADEPPRPGDAEYTDVGAYEGPQSGVLSKKTGRPGSISLTQDEFDAVMDGQYKTVEVSSTSGKRIKTVPASAIARAIQRGSAFLRQVEDDPEKPSYWVVKI